MQDFWLIHCSYIDVIRGICVPDATIHITDGKIAAVGGAPPQGAETVDLTGKTVSPGLIDAHVHILGLNTISPYAQVIRAVEYCRTHLRGGVVMVRDVGALCPDGGDTAAIELARAIRTGVAQNCCRVVTSGRSLTPTYGRQDSDAPVVQRRAVADTDGEIIKTVRYFKQLGADLIKVMATGSGHDKHADLSYYPLEQLELMVREAHRIGMRVAAHTVAPSGTSTCIDAGIDSLEHAPFISEEYLARAAERGLFYVPTMCVYRHLAAHMPGEPGRRSQMTVQGHRDTVPRAYKAGLTLVTGSDNPGPCGFGNGEPQVLTEMLLFEELGVTPMDCIRAATINAARLLDQEDCLGSIEPGKDADLVILDANPLEDLHAYERIAQVYQAGRAIL